MQRKEYIFSECPSWYEKPSFFVDSTQTSQAEKQLINLFCKGPFTPRMITIMITLTIAIRASTLANENIPFIINMHWCLHLKCSKSVNSGGFWLPMLLSLYHLEQIILKVIPAVLFLCVVIVWTFLFSQH